MQALTITSRLVIPASDLTWTAVRSSGPGGQNVNKVASKVELRFALEQSASLSPIVKSRLRVLAAHRLTREGDLLITSQLTRDQSRNLQDALDRLAALIRQALVVPRLRRPTRPTHASVERRLSGKRHQARLKADRRGTAD